MQIIVVRRRRRRRNSKLTSERQETNLSLPQSHTHNRASRFEGLGRRIGLFETPKPKSSVRIDDGDTHPVFDVNK